jgi:hypothetical protein
MNEQMKKDTGNHTMILQSESFSVAQAQNEGEVWKKIG